ncbi:VOC family protein [Rummeliibacillus sp. JY-2-4R]
MFELDHVVYFTEKNPKEIAQEVTIEGIHPVEGGQHIQWGTCNALLYTESSYIEWLAVENEEIAKSSTQPLTKQLLYDLKAGEGYNSLCLRTVDIESKNRYFNKLGYRTSGVIPAERRTTNGKLIKWKMLFIDQKIDHALPYPFFIEWDQPLEKRYEELKIDGTIQQTNGKLQIKRCIFYVKDVEQKVTQWSRLLSLPAKANSLKLPNTTFEFHYHEGEKERLHTIEIVKI